MSLIDLPFPNSIKSVSAATTSGAGTALAGRMGADISFQVIETATVSAGVVNLEGSLDGATWATLATWTHGTDASGAIKSVTTPVAYVRANVASITVSDAGAVDVWVCVG